MRTYTHAIISYLVASRLSGGTVSNRAATWATAGAALPDMPTLVGSAWLVLRRRRFSCEEFYDGVCGKLMFATPDAALHSAAMLALPALTLAAWRLEDRRGERGLPFLLGWAGHVVADILTHGSDARPPLWPVSRWRFESPISYRERGRYGQAFTVLEHAALLTLAGEALRRRSA